MAFQFNPQAQQQTYAAPAPVQQGIPGHPHNPTDRKDGSLPIEQAWFNWSGQYCDGMANTLQRPVSKSQLVIALFQMLHQDANLQNSVLHLVQQMPIKSKGKKPGQGK